jgi:hypothetical protein
MRNLNIPDSPEAITPEWLTQALQSTGTINSAMVASCEALEIGEGVGFTGRIFRVQIAYKKEETDAPQSLVIKFPSADRTLRGNFWPIYEKEKFDSMKGSPKGLTSGSRDATTVP